ncbi:MAG: phosphate signaling complex protein PhoU [Melioribacteraceae bacterium]|nr:phosphate signaling complex protein PhoU [Melioribacteraceae bacterium]
MKDKFEHMLDDIKKDLVFLANEVEDALYRALKSLENQDREVAQEVVKADKQINLREVEIEKRILSLMALQQPVAIDLRFMVVALKMNNDLERIGDHAKNIAKTVKRISHEPYIKPVSEIPALGKVVKNMLGDSVLSFINTNADLAIEVRQRDKEVDSLCDKIYDEVLEVIKSESQYITQGIEIINVLKHLERIADLSKNLAEDVVFMKEAKIIRYGLGKKDKSEVEGKSTNS